jgi:NADH-quinone oxidoreductase subunit N
MPVGDVLPEIAVLLTAVFALLTAAFVPHERHRLCAFVALAGLAVAAALCGAQIGVARTTFHGVWAIDGASTAARLIILLATALTVLLCPAWFASDRRHGEFYAILLLSALGAMGLAASADLLQLTMSVLLSSVTGYTLAAYHRDWPLSIEAGMKYFLVGALANTALVLGVTLMFGMLGSTGFAGLAEALETAPASPLLMVGLALVVVGLAFKLGAVPAHAWMPDVAEGSPVPAAAFLTVVPKVGAAIALARLVSLFPPESLAIRPLIAGLSLVTMTLGNLAALWQEDVRRLIGWSSVSQSGYALMAVAVIGLDELAVAALLFFLLGYTLANLAAFAAVAYLRGRTALSDYDGLAAAQPLAATVLILGFLSLVGIPPLAGFVGKLQLFGATIGGGYGWLAVAAVVNTVVSLFYYLRVIGPAYFGTLPRRVATLGEGARAAALGAAVLVVVAGLAANLLLGWFVAARMLP